MLYTITKQAETEIKLSRSRFICFLFPCKDLTLVRSILSEHNKAYATATHNCYAYVLGSKQEIQYYSDAGEPSGTAGKPMLNALLRNEMTNVLAIVTRYYGGVKLGVKGLIDAYGLSVQSSIEISERVEYVELVTFRLWVDYAVLEQIKYHLQALKAELRILEYAESVQLEIDVPTENQIDLKIILDSFIQFHKVGLLD